MTHGGFRSRAVQNAVSQVASGSEHDKLRFNAGCLPKGSQPFRSEPGCLRGPAPLFGQLPEPSDGLKPYPIRNMAGPSSDGAGENGGEDGRLLTVEVKENVRALNAQVSHATVKAPGVAQKEPENPAGLEHSEPCGFPSPSERSFDYPVRGRGFFFSFPFLLP